MTMLSVPGRQLTAPLYRQVTSVVDEIDQLLHGDGQDMRQK